VRPGFAKPDFNAPIDVEAQKQLVPPGATAKGMQLQALVDECKRRGAPIAGRRYTAFRDYPGAELIDLLVLAAERAWPTFPRREGMRRLGRVAYPTFRSSIVGRVLLGSILGPEDIPGAWPLLAKAYSISGSVGGATVIETGDKEALVRMEGIYSFVDCWHVGIFEGLVDAFDRIPEIFLKVTSPTSADFWIRWRTKD
jgi:uncharacterized protein (TIGR02265 family)